MHRLISTAIAATLCLPGLTGCGSSTSSDVSCSEPTSPAIFELGTGRDCFERLTPGQTITVLAGPQGGYHVWTSFGCADCGGKTFLEYGVKDGATQEWLNGAPAKIVANLSREPWAQQAGIRALLPGSAWATQGPDQRPPVGLSVSLSMRVVNAANIEVHHAEIPLVLGESQTLPSSCPECR